MRIENIILLCTVLLCGCEPAIEESLRPVGRCADAPVAVTSAACFSVNGQGYIFGGREADGTLNNHLYRYDPAKDEWSDMGATPLKARVRPRAVAAGGDVYIGLGFNGKVLIDSAYLCDWWRWNPATNTWTELKPYPSDRTVGPVVSTDGQAIYVAFGGKQNFERWIFRYDIAHDEWIQLSDGLARMAAYPPRAHSVCGGMCGNRFYLGSGYTRDESSDFWVEAELREDSIIWHRLRPMQGKRHNSAASSDSEAVYVSGGHHGGGTLSRGRLYDDILRYDVSQDLWERIGRLPDGERENMISWIIDGRLYVGCGNDKRDQPCAQLYYIPL
ncbi:MAG: hypothetical protein J6T71_03895 [Paludibacteraceae bacterium]|nr:hypothetical protein [Paludibacteraceae bacterium]